jgi:hypothetical protein
MALAAISAPGGLGSADDCSSFRLETAKKIEPQFSAAFGFLLLTLAFDVRRFMRQLTKAKRPPSM